MDPSVTTAPPLDDAPHDEMQNLSYAAEEEEEEEDANVDRAGVEDVEVALAPTEEYEDNVTERKVGRRSSSKRKSSRKEAEQKEPPPAAAAAALHDRSEIRYYRMTLASNLWFMIASVFYVWLSAITLNYYKQLEGVPAWVLQADDDYSWYGYIEDDYVFETNKGTWVSRYSIVYSIAALGFVFTGCLDFVKEPGILGIMFILAGGFGLASAMTVDVNPNLSVIFNAVSVHMFMLEAIGLLFRRSFFGHLEIWLRISDSCFLIGSLMDVAISYTAIFDVFNTTLAVLGVVAACLWVITALIYVFTTCAIQKQEGFEDAMHHDDHEVAKGQPTAAAKDETPTEEKESDESDRGEPEQDHEVVPEAVSDKGLQEEDHQEQEQDPELADDATPPPPVAPPVEANAEDDGFWMDPNGQKD